MDNAVCISVRGLCKSYDGKTAVDGLSLRIMKGEVFGFLGPNGAGKTTTMKLLAGVIRPDSGVIAAAGIELLREPVRYKKAVGFIPDTPFFYQKLTGFEYLEMIMNLYGCPRDAFSAASAGLLRLFSLEEQAGGLIESYSRGMLQKLAIVSVFARKPEAVLIDEPIVGLDPESVRKFKDLIRERAASGGTIFLSTHILEIAEKICDRVAVIHQGKILFTGTAAELNGLYGNASFEDVFLRLTAEKE